MKKLHLLFFAFLLFTFEFASAQIPSYVPTNGLVGWWPFNGNANDESGNGNHGTVNGATLTTDRNGNTGKAYGFNGTYISVPMTSLLHNLPMRSFSVWYKANGSQSGGRIYETTYMNGGIAIYGGNTLDAWYSNGQYECNVTSVNSGSLNQWHHLVYITNSATGLGQVYIDGVFNSSRNGNITSSPQNWINNFLRFGMGASGESYNGSLDDIAIYNRALTQQEITALYTGVPTCIANITNNDTTICSGSSVTLNATALASTSLTDINGNIYPAVNIGTQTWTQKNLNVSRYRNGDVIPQVTDPTQWANLTTGAWCWYNNDSANYWQYGKLYNWYAVNDPRGLAPVGWHVPTNREWDLMTKYLDPTVDTTITMGWPVGTNIGTQLKNTTGWNSGGNGTNSSGFTGLPGGLRYSYGLFTEVGNFGYWWSASEYGSGAWFRNLYYSSSYVYKGDYYKTGGFSVRVISDLNPNNYLWSNGATMPSINVSPTTTTKYYYTVSNGTTTCKDSVTVTVSTINPNFISADTLKVCGTSTTINAISGYTSYSWSNGATTASTTVTASGWYKCTATNGACTAKDSVYVSLFNPQISQNDTTVCSGTQLNLKTTSSILTDITSNAYPIINIGSQTWMQKNLNVNRYRNGDLIPQITSPTQWANLTTGAWCWYNNDSATYAAIYGRLYNWYAVNDTRGLAPAGWHIPSDSEWNSMIKYLDISADTGVTGYQSTTAGGALKDTGVTYWSWIHPTTGVYNVGATNSSKFTGLPGGIRSSTGTFDRIGGFGNCWTATQFNSTNSWGELLDYYSSGVWRSYSNIKSGMSIRCVSDMPYFAQTSCSWSTGATSPSISVSPTTTTSYIATISNGINTCKDTVKVTVPTLNSNFITVDTIKVCGSPSTTITAGTGFTTYSWSNGATTASTIITTNGWYKCTVTNNIGCTATDSVYVSLFNPQIVQNDTTICAGSSLTLNVNAPSSSFATDIDGNVYPTVNIGTQTWSKKNLNVSRYRNGDIIPQVTSSTQWANLTTGAWCWYNNDSVNYSKYGKLYNWYAVNDPRGLVPIGWQIPNETSWNKLCKYLDNNADTSCVMCYQSSTVGGSLKETGIINWISPNTGATNISGFSMIASGGRYNVGDFISAGYYGLLWSSEESDISGAYDRFFNYSNGSLYKGADGKKTGESVRFVNYSTYLWSTGATTPSITVSPTATTSYIATVSNGINTCKDTVKVTINPINSNFITADTLKVCGSNSTTITAGTGFTTYSWSNGANTATTSVTTSGWYRCTVTNATGCSAKDSVYVSFRQPKQTNLTRSACNSFTLPWGVTVTTSGIYSNIYTAANGCDSTVSVAVTIKNATSSTNTVFICSSAAPYVWNGVSYSTSGTYSYRTTNAAGCDSIAYLNLTVSAPASSVTNALVCITALPYIWNGYSYNTSGTYVVHLSTANGCDSAAVLNLTVSNGTPAAPTAITQRLIDTTCGARIYRYTSGLVTNANAYAWIIPTSLGGIAGVTVDSGNINSSSAIRLKFVSNTAASATDSIKVRAYSGCGTSVFKAFKLTNVVLNPPAAPNSITIMPISTNICGNRIYRYTAPALPAGTATLAKATGYLWSFMGSLGANASVDSGTLTGRVVRIKYTNNTAAVTGDSVTVRYNSSCGYGAYKALKLSNAALNPPAAPASITITKIDQLVCGQPRYRYTAPVLPAATTTSGAATGYNWMFTGFLSSAVVVDSGSLTSRIFTVRYTSDSAAVTGDSVKVRYSSACGFSPYRAIKLTNTKTGTNPPLAPASITISLVSNVCGARVYRYTAPTLPIGTTTNTAATGYLWLMPFGPVGSTGLLDSGTLTSRVILVKYSSNAAAGVGDSLRLRYNSLCGYGPNKTVKLSNLLLSGCPVNIPTTKHTAIQNKIDEFDVMVYPNPSKGQFNLQLNGLNPDKVSIRIMDMQGRVLKTIFSTPKSALPISLYDLSAGNYLLEVRQGRNKRIVNVVKE